MHFLKCGDEIKTLATRVDSRPRLGTGNGNVSG